MLNNGARTETQLKTLLVLLVRRGNDLDLRGKMSTGLCHVGCHLLMLRLGLNVNVLLLLHIVCLHFSARCTFALWDVSEVKTEGQTIARQISRKTHKGKHQIKIHWMGAHMLCCAAGLTACEDIAFFSSMAQV